MSGYKYVKKHRDKKYLEEIESKVNDFMFQVTEFYQRKKLSSELWQQSIKLSHEMLAEIQTKKELL